MSKTPRSSSALREPGRSEARAVGALLLAGTGLVALTVILPHPSGADTSALVATAAAMFVIGLLTFCLARRIPIVATHLLLAGVAALTGALIFESGIATGQYGAIFVWATLISAYFFPRRLAVAQLAWLLLVYAAALASVENIAGYSPLARWLFSAVTLTVVMALTSAIVARRAKADLRARRFFELSHDMLSTSDMSGHFVELNSAWEECLGYTGEELRAQPFVEFVHPDDRERTEAVVAGLFEGVELVGFENRYRAKGGSWHWLRWSATLAADEALIYARATDVTELKRIETEREHLLSKVEALAHSDALTGLPNRRALDELLVAGMTRARRSGSPLCLAVLDLDRFKIYNDSHGHLAGDRALRDCAAAWDAKLRGGDIVARFGGEEFVVVLPDCPLDGAAETLERLRAATPEGQTCSVGLACWDFAETAEELLGRADTALYAAKDAGRDRLVQALPAES
ncbi:MAG TPA: diguanylate cyclase [Solirubrobacterales bacterium]|jgi:diguanylate cyclase (GGDEF)-like protein/PAS domain S-box-containing protein|nr:diguanylate cyclase [Solirubrobacterales bacterium]